LVVAHIHGPRAHVGHEAVVDLLAAFVDLAPDRVYPTKARGDQKVGALGRRAVHEILKGSHGQAGEGLLDDILPVDRVARDLSRTVSIQIDRGDLSESPNAEYHDGLLGHAAPRR